MSRNKKPTITIALFSSRLRQLVGSLGITDARFSSLCGLTPAATSQLLNGKRTPSLETLHRIHMATGCSIDHLVGIKLGYKYDKQLNK